MSTATERGDGGRTSLSGRARFPGFDSGFEPRSRFVERIRFVRVNPIHVEGPCRIFGLVVVLVLSASF